MGLGRLHHDPLSPLLGSGHPAVVYWACRDLLAEDPGTARERLWDLPIPRRIVRLQAPGGSWTYRGRRARGATDYDLLETYRQLGFLIAMYGYSREHPSVAAAAEYILGHQSGEGDIRGIYGNQYSPNYTAGLVELLAKAGYAEDPRIESAFGWLEAARQDDGGWALPLRTRGRNLDAINEQATITADRTRPFSHLITGVVLRAYAAHPRHRSSATAQAACALLAGRLFRADAYPDKGRPEDWTGFSYPFWMTDLVSALDAMSFISPGLRHPNIDRALGWFIDHQEPGGLFGGHLLRDRFHDLPLWFSLSVCRIFTRWRD